MPEDTETEGVTCGEPPGPLTATDDGIYADTTGDPVPTGAEHDARERLADSDLDEVADCAYLTHEADD